MAGSGGSAGRACRALARFTTAAVAAAVIAARHAGGRHEALALAGVATLVFAERTAAAVCLGTALACCAAGGARPRESRFGAAMGSGAACATGAAATAGIVVVAPAAWASTVAGGSAGLWADVYTTDTSSTTMREGVCSAACQPGTAQARSTSKPNAKRVTAKSMPLSLWRGGVGQGVGAFPAGV